MIHFNRKLICSFCFSVLLLYVAPTWAEDATSSNQEMLLAVTRGDVSRVEAALAEGADVNTKTSAGRTPLMLAAAHGNTRVATALRA